MAGKEHPMTDIYAHLGIRPIINARGTHTRLGGSLMSAEVLDAMRDAARSYIVLDELQECASRIIARMTGADAGMVTGGAAAALLIGTAACVAGADPQKIALLPETTGMRNEAIMHRAHRNGYDHSVRAAGVTMVDVGYGHGTLPYQLEAAFTEQTALVVYLISPWASRGALPLTETCEIAHRHGIPVLVDAAAALPPAGNLTRFITEGADLVALSGGKGINGPQSSGILAGRADLICAALMNGSPSHSVGRTAKAAKEDIVGLIVALQRYGQRDHAADLVHWRNQAEYLVSALSGLPQVDVAVVYDGREHITPRVELVFRPGSGVDVHELVTALEDGEPRLFLFEPNGPSARAGSVIINTQTLQRGEERVIAAVLREEIAVRLHPGETYSP